MLKILLGIILILLFLHLITFVLTFFVKIENTHLLHLVGVFDFNTEMNIPTYFSALILLCASLILFSIVMINKRQRSPYFYWLGLAIVFLFLSFDEITAIHEQFLFPTQKLLNASGYLYFAWVIPYGIFTIILGVIYFKFLLRLPKTTLLLFILSAFIFISGAIGLELFEAKHYELYGLNNITYILLYTVEELFEMLGTTIFIYALLSYAENQFGQYIFRIEKK